MSVSAKEKDLPAEEAGIVVTVETAKELGLLPEEFEKIKKVLGRVPNFTELSIYSVMWSEHCSYKNSIVWLKTLPKEGLHMLATAGQENAGLVETVWLVHLKLKVTITRVLLSPPKGRRPVLVEYCETFSPWVRGRWPPWIIFALALLITH